MRRLIRQVGVFGRPRPRRRAISCSRRARSSGARDGAVRVLVAPAVVLARARVLAVRARPGVREARRAARDVREPRGDPRRARRARRPHAVPAPARRRLLPDPVDGRVDARVQGARRATARPPTTPPPSARATAARPAARVARGGRGGDGGGPATPAAAVAHLALSRARALSLSLRPLLPPGLETFVPTSVSRSRARARSDRRVDALLPRARAPQNGRDSCAPRSESVLDPALVRVRCGECLASAVGDEAQAPIIPHPPHPSPPPSKVRVLGARCELALLLLRRLPSAAARAQLRARRDSAGGCCDWSPTGDGAADPPWWLWDPSTWPPQVPPSAALRRARARAVSARDRTERPRVAVVRPGARAASRRALSLRPPPHPLDPLESPSGQVAFDALQEREREQAAQDGSRARARCRRARRQQPARQPARQPPRARGSGCKKAGPVVARTQSARPLSVPRTKVARFARCAPGCAPDVTPGPLPRPCPGGPGRAAEGPRRRPLAGAPRGPSVRPRPHPPPPGRPPFVETPNRLRAAETGARRALARELDRSRAQRVSPELPPRLRQALLLHERLKLGVRGRLVRVDDLRVPELLRLAELDLARRRAAPRRRARAGGEG